MEEAETRKSNLTGTTVASTISSKTNQEKRKAKYQKIQEAGLVQTVTTQLWKKAKFVYDESDLDYGEPISDIVLDDMQILHGKRERVWNNWARGITKKALNSKRNTVCTNIKKSLVGEFIKKMKKLTKIQEKKKKLTN